MNKLTSYNINTSVYNRRVGAYYLHHDPLGLNRYENYLFDMVVFDSYEEESMFRVINGSQLFHKGSTFNDYYGPGTSVDESLKEAESWMSMFSTEAIPSMFKAQIVITLTPILLFQDEENDPFYNRSVRMYRVPGNWWRQGTRKWDEQPGLEPVDYVVWENGHWTEAATQVENQLMEWNAADQLGHLRRGELKPVRRFTQEVQPEDA